MKYLLTIAALASICFTNVSRAQVVLTFDDLAAGPISTQYQAQGATFNFPLVRDYSPSPGFAHSGTKAIELCFAAEFCKSPLNVNFTAGETHVKVFVGFTSQLSQASPVLLRAWDANGALVGQQTAVLGQSTGPIPVQIPLEVTSAAANIRQITVGFASSDAFNNGLVLDDLAFDAAGPPPDCTAPVNPSVTLSQPHLNSTVQINEFMLQGEVTTAAPLDQATLTVTGPGGTKVTNVLGTIVQPISAPFGEIRVDESLFPGTNTVTLVVHNCHGTSQASTTVTYAPVANGTVIKLLGMEITQATQDLNNSVPLIAGKPTMVRLYFTTTGSTNAINAVRGDITGFREGGNTPLLAQSVGTTDVDTSHDVGAKRLDLTKSLNFVLPSDFCQHGLLHFWVERLNVQGPGGATLACDGCDNWSASFEQDFEQDVPAPVLRSQADAFVSTREQLLAAFKAGKKVIWIENTAKIDLSLVTGDGAPDPRVMVPDGTTIASGRSATELGGMLFDSRRIAGQRYMLGLGNHCRITGLRLRGPSRSTEEGLVESAAILVKEVQDIVVDRNEMYNWPGSSVDLRGPINTFETAGRVRVTSNYIHHNLQCGAGYGVWIDNEGTFAVIDLNVFDDNRHHVAGHGDAHSGYVAERNLVLSSGEKCGVGLIDPGYYNQHFDMHGLGSGGYGGIAGETIQIVQNTIRGAQSYYVTKTRPAFWLRGNPTAYAYFGDNVLEHKEGDAIRTKGANSPNLVVKNNRYGMDTSLELGVGDFDGDGFQDVFQATGGVWVYSPRGQREWRYLNYVNPYHTSQLRFGDFDGDGKTDVFVQIGDTWLFSSGGTQPLRQLPMGSNIDIRRYCFGDFIGDKKTDVFYADGTEWFVSDGAAKPWQHVAFSTLKVDDLGFGDFNGDGKTDVFSFANGDWSVAYAGEWTWRKLNNKIGSDMSKLVFGHFNGQGTCDVAMNKDGKWYISFGGKSPWTVLNENPDGYPLESMLIGDFDGDHHADALHYERNGFKFVMSKSGASTVSVRTEANMR